MGRKTLLLNIYMFVLKNRIEILAQDGGSIGPTELLGHLAYEEVALLLTDLWSI